MLRLPFLSLSLFVVSSAFASPTSENSTDTKPFCGTVISEEQLVLEQKDFHNRLATNERSTTVASERLNAQDAVIPVYWHVIYADASFNGGNIPDSMIYNQIDVINEGFAPTGLQFQLADVTHTQNSYWFNYVDPETAQPQYDMKNQLRNNNYGPAALNIYSLGLNNIVTPGTLGYATFPWDYGSNQLNDGIIIRYSTLPGGNSPGNNFGKVLTHEVGHWVGLLHTFQGGCFGPGDYVYDTPPEAVEAVGCPIGRDTCFGGGIDPIHNYMDYTADTCRDEFTAGQIQRLQNQINIFRGIFV